MNVQISTVDKIPPMKIDISYEPAGGVLKHVDFVKCYHSWHSIIPSESYNDGVIFNPKNLVFNEHAIHDKSQTKP